MYLSFSNDEFISAFEAYNQYVFPFQGIIFLAGILAVILIHTKKESRHATIAVIIGALWLWTGIFYHILYVSELTYMGFFFGTLAALQGFFFMYESLFRDKLQFEISQSSRNTTGYILIITGLIIYPLIGIISGNEMQEAITLGLPCPSTIFTFGILMLTTRKLPLYLLIIPTLWALIGFTISIGVNMYEDALLLISAIIADVWLLRRKNYDREKHAPLE